MMQMQRPAQTTNRPVATLQSVQGETDPVKMQIIADALSKEADKAQKKVDEATQFGTARGIAQEKLIEKGLKKPAKSTKKERRGEEKNATLAIESLRKTATLQHTLDKWGNLVKVMWRVTKLGTTRVQSFTLVLNPPGECQIKLDDNQVNDLTEIMLRFDTSMSREANMKLLMIRMAETIKANHTFNSNDEGYSPEEEEESEECEWEEDDKNYEETENNQDLRSLRVKIRRRFNSSVTFSETVHVDIIKILKLKKMTGTDFDSVEADNAIMTADLKEIKELHRILHANNEFDIESDSDEDVDYDDGKLKCSYVDGNGNCCNKRGSLRTASSVKTTRGCDYFCKGPCAVCMNSQVETLEPDNLKKDKTWCPEHCDNGPMSFGDVRAASHGCLKGNETGLLRNVHDAWDPTADDFVRVLNVETEDSVGKSDIKHCVITAMLPLAVNRTHANGESESTQAVYEKMAVVVGYYPIPKLRNVDNRPIGGRYVTGLVCRADGSNGGNVKIASLDGQTIITVCEERYGYGCASCYTKYSHFPKDNADPDEVPDADNDAVRAFLTKQYHIWQKRVHDKEPDADKIPLNKFTRPLVVEELPSTTVERERVNGSDEEDGSADEQEESDPEEDPEDANDEGVDSLPSDEDEPSDSSSSPDSSDEDESGDEDEPDIDSEDEPLVKKQKTKT
jgi:hypothetical protein